MSMFECYICGGAIGMFCHCKEPALSEEDAQRIREKREIQAKNMNGGESSKKLIEDKKCKENCDCKCNNKEKSGSSLTESQMKGYIFMSGFDV